MKKKIYMIMLGKKVKSSAIRVKDLPLKVRKKMTIHSFIKP